MHVFVGQAQVYSDSNIMSAHDVIPDATARHVSYMVKWALKQVQSGSHCSASPAQMILQEHCISHVAVTFACYDTGQQVDSTALSRVVPSISSSRLCDVNRSIHCSLSVLSSFVVHVCVWVCMGLRAVLPQVCGSGALQ